MNLGERLRGVLAPVRGAGVVTPAPRTTEHDAAETLDGEWREARGQRFLVVERTYRPGHRHGHMALADALPSSSGLWPRLDLLAGTECSGRALFIDLETTGLAGGAGTYAFLVGCAWFQDATLRMQQFFLASFGAERVLLEAVAALAGDADVIVSYNGKSFDLPVMETRYVMHRMETPFAGMPHVDLLHPARRMWRRDDDEGSGCKLTTLERTLCGHEREGDVPGFEIPARYFNYVRTGDARPLAAVLEHNRLDLLALALLTARATQLVEEGAAGVRSAREALGIGCLYERHGLTTEARACYVRAAELAASGDWTVRAEALRACAVLARRERRYEEAAAAWRQVVEQRRCPPSILREATEALAVHHEHRLRDPLTARTFALRALPLQGTPTRREAVQHRLARLNRKLGDVAEAALF